MHLVFVLISFCVENDCTETNSTNIYLVKRVLISWKSWWHCIRHLFWNYISVCTSGVWKKLGRAQSEFWTNSQPVKRNDHTSVKISKSKVCQMSKFNNNSLCVINPYSSVTFQCSGFYFVTYQQFFSKQQSKLQLLVLFGVLCFTRRSCLLFCKEVGEHCLYFIFFWFIFYFLPAQNTIAVFWTLFLTPLTSSYR